jgi:hypothetical protein
MIGGIATHSQRKGVYEFKEQIDDDFIDAYPEVGCIIRTISVVYY